MHLAAADIAQRPVARMVPLSREPVHQLRKRRVKEGCHSPPVGPGGVTFWARGSRAAEGHRAFVPWRKSLNGRA